MTPTDQQRITYPAAWAQAPFQLGQIVYLRDADNRRVQVVGLVHGGRAEFRDDYWLIYTIEEPRQITADCYGVRELSAEPLLDEDPDYQGYCKAGGALDWHAWRLLVDRYQALIPVMWQTPTPPEPPELTELKQVLLISD